MNKTGGCILEPDAHLIVIRFIVSVLPFATKLQAPNAQSDDTNQPADNGVEMASEPSDSSRCPP